MDLTDRDKAMLTLADTRFASGGRKEAAMRDLFDVGPTHFWQRVDWLLRTAEAEAWDAVRVRRLVRLREKRRGWRTARVRLG